jgi:hypothetical protein
MLGADGNELSLEDKFAVLGHKRNPQINMQVEKTLKNKILKFLQNGGDIYIQKTDLPFFRPDYTSYARAQRANGVTGDLSFQMNMRKLGFDYSEMFYRYGKVERLKYFKDGYGYVDSYRKQRNEQFC